MDNLDSGFALLTFQKAGYISQSVPYSFAAGQSVKDSNVRLVPAGVVSGRLTNSLGGPVTNTLVTLYGYHATPAGREMFRTKDPQGSTDDRGEFRLFDIPPGRYLLAFEGYFPREVPPDKKANSPEIPDLPAVFPTLYPGVSEISNAEMIEVKSGEETRLRNVRLQSQQGTIRTNFINAPGEPDKKVVYGITYATPLPGGYGQRNYPTNTFQIAAGGSLTKEIWLPQFGVYAMAVSWTSAGETSVVLVTPINFSGETVNTDIVLSRPNGRLKIHASIQQIDGTVSSRAAIGICRADAPACASKSFWLSQRPLSEATLPAITTALGSDGTLNLKAIVPGRYELYSLAVPDGYYIASANQGGRSVLIDGIVISEDSPSLEIQIRPNAGILRGMVTDRKNQPVQNALVALLPAPPLDRSKLQVLRRVIRTDQSGSFELRNIIPGDYRAYAWADQRDDAYMDDEFVAAFRDVSLPVHISTDHLGTEGPLQLSILN